MNLYGSSVDLILWCTRENEARGRWLAASQGLSFRFGIERWADGPFRRMAGRTRRSAEPAWLFSGRRDGTVGPARRLLWL